MSRVWLLSCIALLATSAGADSCPKAELDGKLNLSLPCIGVNGQYYQARLERLGGVGQGLSWRLADLGEMTCAWDIKTCATADSNLRLTIPGLVLDGSEITARLDFAHGASGSGELSWTYFDHAPTQSSRGSIDNSGTLPPYEVHGVSDGRGRKLLAIYMVGSNLESGSSQAATTDLFELIGGYRSLDSKNIDVIVAFGGSAKDNWRGMKFANMDQLLEDSYDARFGNAANYLYRADNANMGDVSSLRHFLNYLRDSYVDYDASFMVFWDHGASYRGFGNDEVYNMKALSLPDIEQALADSGQRFELIGFDACLMASLETAKFTHSYANYLLASEDLEPGHGWNWTHVIRSYAFEDDPVEMAKSIIDNYVNNDSHPYRSSGKTLSLVDLSRFSGVEDAMIPVLSQLTSSLSSRDTATQTMISESLGKSRAYSGSYRVAVDFKDLASYMTSLTSDATLAQTMSPLSDALGEYILYARHDGTRPNSYGASLDRLDNAPYKVSVNTAMTDLQNAWRLVVEEDQGAPRVVDGNDRVMIKSLTEVSEYDLQLLRDYIDDGNVPAAALDWWEQAYVILSDQATSLTDKLAAIASLENESAGVFDGGVIRDYYLKKGVEIVRAEIVDLPRSPRGVAISRSVAITRSVAVVRSGAVTTPAERDGVDFILRPLNTNQTGLSADSDAWSKAEARAMPELGTRRQRAVPSSKPTSLTEFGSRSEFADDNPIKVTAVYGTLYEDPATGEARDFDVFAEVEALATQDPGSYFSYAWNRMWYTVKYDPEQSSLWLPMRFASRFWKEGESISVYTGEIYYRDWQALYPEVTADEPDACASQGLIEYKDKCFQQAILELHVDSNNAIVEHHVRPYQVVSGQIQFEKDSSRLRSGDEVSFLFDSFGLEPGASFVRMSNAFAGSVAFAQDPEFDVEMMTAVSASTLLPKRFYYALRATDIAGNSTISPPVLAQTPMPACSSLTRSEDVLDDVLGNLDSLAPITYVSDTGKDLDEALSILMVTAEAEQDADFLTDVESLYGVVYNANTLDRERTDWIWGDRVDWGRFEVVLGEALPSMKRVVERECAN